MPTLEDVFLNVAAEDTKLEKQNMTKEHRKFSSPDIDNDKILFETNFREDYSSTGKSKFINDFKACFNRRFLLTTRDVKGFLMEILCPILLCVIGLLVSQVDFQRASGKQYLDMGAIGKQDVLFGKLNDNINLDNYKFDITNVTNKYIDFDKSPNTKRNIYNFVEKVFDQVKDKEDSIEHEVDMMDKKYVGIYGAYLMLQDSNNQYKYVEVINSRVKHGVAIYTHFFLKKIIEKASPNVKINYIHYPLPLTAQLEEQRDQANNMLVIFFIAIAFALIPANFITIIVKEKNNNSNENSDVNFNYILPLESDKSSEQFNLISFQGYSEEIEDNQNIKFKNIPNQKNDFDIYEKITLKNIENIIEAFKKLSMKVSSDSIISSLLIFVS